MEFKFTFELFNFQLILNFKLFNFNRIEFASVMENIKYKVQNKENIANCNNITKRIIIVKLIIEKWYKMKVIIASKIIDGAS